MHGALRLQQHQLQDDHYDHLLDRDDYIRQARRLAARVADRRRELTGGWPRGDLEPLAPTAPAGDATTARAVLRRHVARVDVDPHPRGVGTASGAGWDARRRVVARLLRPHLARRRRAQGVPRTDQMCASAPWVSPD